MNKIALPALLAACLLIPAAVFADCDSSITAEKPSSLYSDHNNGVVTDNETGLMWQKCTLGLSGQDCETGTAAELTWQAALERANSNASFTYDDWRLPNDKELLSLVEHSCMPAINSAVFPNMHTDRYWSSAPVVSDDGLALYDGFALYLEFGWGDVRSSYKRSRLYVRLVRNSQ